MKNSSYFLARRSGSILLLQLPSLGVLEEVYFYCIEKKAAKLFLAASLVAALVQMNYWLFFTSVVDVYGNSAYAMPTVVILVAFALYRLSASGIKKRYLY